MQVHQPSDDDAGAGAAADHLQRGPPLQAIHPGALSTYSLLLLARAVQQLLHEGEIRHIPNPTPYLTLPYFPVAQAHTPGQNWHYYSIQPPLLCSHFCAPRTLLLVQALIHGLNRHYYSIGINYRKTELEERMLLNLQASKSAHCQSAGGQ